jgi:hypothetical protein
MKIIAALVIGFYAVLAIGILIHLISQRRRERNPHKDQ